MKRIAICILLLAMFLVPLRTAVAQDVITPFLIVLDWLSADSIAVRAMSVTGTLGAATVESDSVNIAARYGGPLLLSREDASTVENDTLGKILFDSEDNPSSIDASAGIIGISSTTHGPGAKGGRLTFSTKADGTDDSEVMIERMRIDEDGNVGIGMTGPNYLLTVNKASPISDEILFAVQNNGNNKFTVDEDGDLDAIRKLTMSGSLQIAGAVVGGHGSINFNIDTRDVEDIIFRIDEATEIVRFTSTGNVGIGTTTPADNLHVINGMRISEQTEAASTDSVQDFGFTNGNPYHKMKGAVTGVASDKFVGYTATFDGSAATIYTLATVTDTDYLISVDFVGAQDDGTNEYYASIKFCVSNVSGTVTEDSENDIMEDDNSAAGAADASGTVSGTNYQIQVTGVAAETWTWTATVNVTSVYH